MQSLRRPEPTRQRAPAVFVLALAALFWGAGGCSPTVEVVPERVPPDQVVVLLNGEPISLEEFDTEFRLMAIHYSAVTETQMRSIKRHLFDQVVDRRILVQMALKRGMQVSRAELEKALRDALKDAPSGYLDLLKEEGVTEEAWRRKVAQEFLVRQLADRVAGGRATVSNEEVESYYWSHLSDYWKPEAVRARHLVVQTTRELTEAQARLTHGDTFASVAAALSSAPSAGNEPDWGYMPLEGLSPSFAHCLLSLKPGQVSKPIKDGFGWHLFQLVEIRPTRMRRLEDVRAEIRDLLIRKEQDRLFLQYLAALKRSATVKVNQDLASVVGIVWEDTPDEATRKIVRKIRRRHP